MNRFTKEAVREILTKDKKITTKILDEIEAREEYAAARQRSGKASHNSAILFSIKHNWLIKTEIGEKPCYQTNGKQDRLEVFETEIPAGTFYYSKESKSFHSAVIKITATLVTYDHVYRKAERETLQNWEVVKDYLMQFRYGNELMPESPQVS